MSRRLILGLLHPFPNALVGEKYDIAPNMMLKRKPKEFLTKVLNTGWFPKVGNHAAVVPLQQAEFILEVSYQGAASKACDDDCVERLIRVERAMRLVKPSPVHIPYLFYLVDDRFETFALGRGRRYRPLLEGEDPALGEVRDADLAEVGHAYEWVSQVDRRERSRLFFALHEYEIAYEMQYAELQTIVLASALESLFTTGRQEITEKLALRTAWFLESDVVSREQTYRNVKDFYGLRGHYAHGGTKKRGDMAEVKRVIRFAERALCRCFQKIRAERLEDNFSKKKVEEYLVSLTLGSSEEVRDRSVGEQG